MRIGIIGCGVAGQAASIELSRAGHDVALFERFARPRPLGAGLLLQPSGLLALDRLGLRDAALRRGACVFELDGRIVGGRRVLDLRYGTGEFGLGLHRGVLFRILHDALTATGARLHLGFEVAAIENAARPSIVSSSGERAGPFDLLLDCAGAHDVLRGSLGVKVRAPLYRWGALWTICRDRAGNFTGKLRQVYDRAHMMIGILPVGEAPDADDGAPHVAFFWSLRLDDVEAQRKAGLDALKARAIAAWPEAAPIVDQIGSFDDLSLASYRRVAMPRPRIGRVLVMGDAAHGTSPQLGQGANLALIDAITLARCLAQDGDADAALSHYERARRGHVGFYSLASRALTPVFQSDGVVLPWLRDTFLARANMLPGGRYLTRTTLSGIRKLPWGLWKAPEP